ncbi:MAG TPA: hypothetical protein VLS89_13920, partial [Candidatus Nanopelagicales bacterium]|nr:hypothetical protein [Candidatus Nanopelagicales bacterium]
MASVFAHLFETLPFVVAVHGARNASGQASGDLPAAQLWPYLQALPRDTDYSPTAPPVPSSSTDVSARRLWRWTHRGSTPHRVSQVTCRVRDTGYKTQVVLDSLEWGYEAPGGGIEPEMRVETEDGRTLALPLTLDYLHSRWLVTGGWIAAGNDLMYPLESYLDYSLVLAFAYELAGPSGVSPYRPRPDDPSEEAIRQYQGGPTGYPDDASDRWVRRAMTGDFMAGATYRPSAVSPGGTTRVSTSAPRVLVALSLAAGRERADFEPGGIVGVARFYPHAMVRASVPLRSIHGGARL